MRSSIKIINPLEFTDWDQRVLSFKDYSFFHSRAWAEILIQTYKYRPVFFTLWDRNRLRAVIPVFEVSSRLSGRRGVALPFTDHCNPLVSDSEDFYSLLNTIIKEGKQRGWQRLEIRGGQNFMMGHPKSSTYHLHRLALSTDEKSLLKKFRNSTRRNIKKAQQQEITIDIKTDFDALKAFFKLNCITRRHHGVPPQPFTFFKSIHEHILSKKHGIIILARKKKKIIAGAIFFGFGRKAMYKYGASRRDCLEIRPNNLIMWEAIKWFGNREYAEFDMGRSEPENAGLNQFKNGWGTEVDKLFYYTYDFSRMYFLPEENKNMAMVNRIFRKTPVPVLRAVGELAYRHMG